MMSESNVKAYLLTVTQVQAEVISLACEAYGRLHMGQIEWPVMQCWDTNPCNQPPPDVNRDAYWETRSRIMDHLRSAEQLWTPPTRRDPPPRTPS